MKKSIFLLASIFLLLIFFSSCTKEKVKGCKDPISINYNPDAEESDGSCEYAGTGGNTTVVAFALHHGDTIFNQASYPDSAFIKFNATEFPGSLPGNYDLVLVGDSGEDHVHIENLKRGKYFIYMTGWDSSIGQRVFGGIPYVLSQSTGEVDLAIPVAED